jgi:hypothetical protein
MSARKIAGLAAGLFLALAITPPVAHTSEMNQAVEMTFDQPVEIPGQVLPAGTYWFQLLMSSSSASKDVVQDFNDDRTYIYATLITVPSERQGATGDTVITFAQKESDDSTVLKGWFYPGRLEGHRFVYPDSEERQLEASQWSVRATETGSCPVTAVVESGD